MRPDPRLEFLARLACGAPTDVLLESWRAAAREDGGLDVRRLAGALGLQSAAAGFAAALDKDERTLPVFHLVADGLRAGAVSETSVDLVRALASRPETAAVEAVVVKGAALRLLGLYGKDERDSVDADIVVRRDRLPSLRAAAEAAGFDWSELPEGGHEAAYVRAGVGLVEIHTCLAGDAGREAGPDWESVRKLAVPLTAPGWAVDSLLALRGAPARELAVQHFLRHHAGEPAFALRSLQDLSRLEADPDGPGLPWPRDAAGLRRAVARLRSVVVALRVAGDLPAAAVSFLARLESAMAVSREPEADYAAGVDRWLAIQGGPARKAALVARSLLAAPAGETGARRMVRPFRMLRRYFAGKVRGRSESHVSKGASDWRGELEKD